MERKVWPAQSYGKTCIARVSARRPPAKSEWTGLRVRPVYDLYPEPGRRREHWVVIHARHGMSMTHYNRLDFHVTDPSLGPGSATTFPH